MKSKILNNKGITLIEVIVVIAIFSLVIILTIPNINNGGENAKQKLLDTKIESIESAAVVYGQDNKNKFNSKCDAVGEACYGIDNCYCYDEDITVKKLIDDGLLNTDTDSNDIINPVTKKSLKNKTVQIYKKYDKIYAIFDKNDNQTSEPEFIDDGDGNLKGLIPLPTEPEPTPDIPEEQMPEYIEFELGQFESKINYTPGEYKEVDYEYTTEKKPVTYLSCVWSKWLITKDKDDKIINIVPEEINVRDIEEQYSTYIVYDYDVATKEKIVKEGVAGDSVKIYTIYNKSDDTLENAIYLAAYLQKILNKELHIAKLNGTIYEEVDYDLEINSVTNFTETKVSKIKVLTSLTAGTTELVYVPNGKYIAEKDMTWDEWLKSEYNTTKELTPNIKTSNGVNVNYDDKIKEGEKYGFIQRTLEGTWYLNDTVEWFDNQYNLIFELADPRFNYGDFKSVSACGARVGTGLCLKYIPNNEAGSPIKYGTYKSKENWLLIGHDRTWIIKSSIKEVTDKNNSENAGEDLYKWLTNNATKINNLIHSLHHEYYIPNGGVYYVHDETKSLTNITTGDYTGYSEMLTTGDTFPNDPKTGDVYVYKGYEYRYNYKVSKVGIDKNTYQLDEEMEGWSVSAIDKDAKSVDLILEWIQYKPVISMIGTFANMSSLESFAHGFNIPKYVTDISSSFSGCTSIDELPDTFILSTNVNNMTEAFYNCASLSGNLKVDANPTYYTNAFKNTQKDIKIIGKASSTTKTNLVSTSNNGNISY